MSILYRLAQDSDPVNRYTDRKAREFTDELNRRMIQRSERELDDFERIKYYEKARRDSKFNVSSLALFLELPLFGILFGRFASWLVSNVPTAMGVALWLMVIALYAVACYTCYKSSDVSTDTDSTRLVLKLFDNDASPDSTPTWEDAPMSRLAHDAQKWEQAHSESDDDTAGAESTDDEQAESREKETSPFERDEGMIHCLFASLRDKWRKRGA